jgi:hypothetical protein
MVLMIASIAVGIVPILPQFYPYRGLLYVKQAAISTELKDFNPSAHHHVFRGCNFELGLTNEGCVSFAAYPRY